MPLEWIIAALAVIAAAASAFSWWGVRKLRRERVPAPQANPASIQTTGDRQRVALILNPVKLGAGLAREQVEQACSDAGWDPPLVLETTVAEPGTTQAHQAVKEGYDVVLAAGGDGTVRAIAPALVHSNAALGLLPLGTGNLLARNLGIAVNDVPRSVRQALHGAGRRIDMGRVELRNERTGVSGQHTFLVMGGVGLDAIVVAATRDALKKKLGWLAYSEAGMRSLPGKRQRMTISIDGGAWQTRKVHSVLFANCGKLPGGITFVPDGTIDDGFLDVIITSPRSILGWLWVAAKIVFRHPGPIPVITYHQVKRVDVKVSEATGTQLDGDTSGDMTSLSVEVVPGALMVRVPGRATGPSVGMFSSSTER
ncbi:diacylglycerol kinase family protein [Arthrobacter tecti]